MLKNRKKKGFTLIELIVVIAILGILAAVLIPKFGGFQDKARGAQVTVDAKQIATALDGLLAEGTTPSITAIWGIADKDEEIQDRITTDLALVGDRGFTFSEKVDGTIFDCTRDSDTGKITVVVQP